MADERELRTRLSAALAARFGEDVALPEALEGLAGLAGIAEHRTYRSYSDRPIAPKLLRLLAAVALSAPSKSDLQQADLILVADPDKRRAIAELIPSMPWVAAAPAFFVVCGNGRRIVKASEQHGIEFANRHLDHFFNATVDAALVLQTLILAAEAVGLGSCPISAIRNQADAVSALLQLPELVFPVAGLCLGWPAGDRPISARLPLAQTLHRDRHDEGDLAQGLAGYDRRRGLAEGWDPAQADFVGWSLAKARMYAESQRADFGRFASAKGFRLV